MHVLILGAGSDIAGAVARTFAKEEKADITLASRDLEVLEARARDIALRYGVRATPLRFDATDYASHAAFYASINPKPDGVVVAFGHLGKQEEAQADFESARTILETNFAGAVSILEIIAADFERRGSGFIIGIGSVAGERGRKSNYIYGASKAALKVYLEGLRHRLFRRKIRVMAVLPGFVRTKMTGSMDLPERLTASPEEVAAAIHAAFRKGRPVVYVKGIWRWIMAVIRLLPAPVFNRLPL